MNIYFFSFLNQTFLSIVALLQVDGHMNIEIYLWFLKSIFEAMNCLIGLIYMVHIIACFKYSFYELLIHIKEIDVY